MVIKVGIVTVSDRCSRGEAKDESGANLHRLLNSGELFDAEVLDVVIVPDEVNRIQEAVLQFCSVGCHVILTTGGTGVAPRDVTPEAVTPLLTRCRLPGIEVAMLNGSLAVTPLAALCRPVAGVRGDTVIVTLPGSTRAAEQCVKFVADALPHAVDLLTDRRHRVEHTHRGLHCGDAVSVDSEHNGASKISPVVKSEVRSKVEIYSGIDRPRCSPYQAVSVAEAQSIVGKILLEDTEHVRRVPVLQSNGLLLSEDARACVSLPPHDVSTKDGYAVRSCDIGVRKLICASHAGHSVSNMKVGAGECVQISTGAEIPDGADCVVMIENTTAMVNENKDEMIEVKSHPIAGDNIRRKGCDFKKGALIMEPGTQIRPFDLAALIAAGVKYVRCSDGPRVSVMSTGDELVDIDGAVGTGSVFDANRHTLAALIKETGAQLTDLGIVRDRPDDLLAALRRGLAISDIIVSSGGVSMGDRDYLKRVLTTDLHATIHFGRVWMKPGLPTTFASLIYDGRRKYVFGLPGNPVSAAVCCILYVQSALRRYFNRRGNRRIVVQVNQKISLGDRPEYKRAYIQGLEYYPFEELSDGIQPTLTAVLTNKDQNSSNVLSMVNCNVLLEIPAKNDVPHKKNKDCLLRGDRVKAIII